jgi:hypothetical protein
MTKKIFTVNDLLRKTILAIIVLLMFAFTVQGAVPVSGRIIESAKNEPLGYANVLLLSLSDSAFVAGATSSEDGFFRFDNVSNGKYMLKVSFIGFEDRLIPVDVSDNPVDLADIHLNESDALTLNEAVVTAKMKPFRSGINGGIVANVASTLLSSVGTANDVLQRMPGIISEEGKMTVFGKGAPIVYINNRKVRDMSELERLESSEILTVELITNPGAKYDAESRAVLLIKTKNKINGFSTQATERIRIGKYMGDNENISIAYTKDRLNLFATYYHNYGKRKAIEDHVGILKNSDGVWRHNMLMPYNFSELVNVYRSCHCNKLKAK